MIVSQFSPRAQASDLPDRAVRVLTTTTRSPQSLCMSSSSDVKIVTRPGCRRATAASRSISLRSASASASSSSVTAPCSSSYQSTVACSRPRSRWRSTACVT